MNMIAGYRKMLEKSQTEMAKIFGISLQAYRSKEIGKTPFSDNEKLKLKKMLLPIFPDITIDDIFFKQKVSKVENSQEDHYEIRS